MRKSDLGRLTRLLVKAVGDCCELLPLHSYVFRSVQHGLEFCVSKSNVLFLPDPMVSPSADELTDGRHSRHIHDIDQRKRLEYRTDDSVPLRIRGSPVTPRGSRV